MIRRSLLAILIALATLSIASAAPAAPRDARAIVAAQGERWNALYAAGD